MVAAALDHNNGVTRKIPLHLVLSLGSSQIMNKIVPVNEVYLLVNLECFSGQSESSGALQAEQQQVYSRGAVCRSCYCHSLGEEEGHSREGGGVGITVVPTNVDSWFRHLREGRSCNDIIAGPSMR